MNNDYGDEFGLEQDEDVPLVEGVLIGAIGARGELGLAIGDGVISS